MSLEQDHILCLLSSICPFISALIPDGTDLLRQVWQSLVNQKCYRIIWKEFEVLFSDSLCFIHSISVWTWIPFSQSFKCVSKFSSNSIFTLQNNTGALAAASWESTSVNWRAVCICCIFSSRKFLSSRCLTAGILLSRKRRILPHYHKDAAPTSGHHFSCSDLQHLCTMSDDFQLPIDVYCHTLSSQLSNMHWNYSNVHSAFNSSPLHTYAAQKHAQLTPSTGSHHHHSQSKLILPTFCIVVGCFFFPSLCNRNLPSPGSLT